MYAFINISINKIAGQGIKVIFAMLLTHSLKHVCGITTKHVFGITIKHVFDIAAAHDKICLHVELVDLLHCWGWLRIQADDILRKKNIRLRV